MGIFIKLRETYPSKESVLGQPVGKGANKKTITVYKDKWTEIPKVTHQMVRLRKYLIIHEGSNPDVKDEIKEPKVVKPGKVVGKKSTGKKANSKK